MKKIAFLIAIVACIFMIGVANLYAQPGWADQHNWKIYEDSLVAVGAANDTSSIYTIGYHEIFGLALYFAGAGAAKHADSTDFDLIVQVSMDGTNFIHLDSVLCRAGGDLVLADTATWVVFNYTTNLKNYVYARLIMDGVVGANDKDPGNYCKYYLMGKE